MCFTALTCGAPNPLQNGIIVGSQHNYKDQITYSCNKGYGLSGNSVRTCQLNSQWSGIEPSCLRKSLNLYTFIILREIFFVLIFHKNGFCTLLRFISSDF